MYYNKVFSLQLLRDNSSTAKAGAVNSNSAS